MSHTDSFIGETLLIPFSSYLREIITKIATSMLAGGSITKTRKADIASWLYNELSDEVTTYRMTSKI